MGKKKKQQQKKRAGKEDEASVWALTGSEVSMATSRSKFIENSTRWKLAKVLLVSLLFSSTPPRSNFNSLRSLYFHQWNVPLKCTDEVNEILLNTGLVSVLRLKLEPSSVACVAFETKFLVAHPQWVCRDATAWLFPVCPSPCGRTDDSH